MINFDKATNPRSNDLENYIDVDVPFGDIIIPYTLTPDDAASKEAYYKFKSSGNVKIKPGGDYKWETDDWVPFGVKEYSNIAESQKLEREAKIRELTPIIDALSDKIEFGLSTDESADKAKLLELRKERALLMQ